MQFAYHLGENPPQEADRTVLRIEAQPLGGSLFRLIGSGAEVHAMCVRGDRALCRQKYGGPLYLPAHSACLQLADRFVDSVESAPSSPAIPSNGITSIKQLWEVIHRRLYGDVLGFPECILPEPHNYFGGRICRNCEWESGEDQEQADVCISIILSLYQREASLISWQLMEQNPMPIPDLTNSILHNLSACPTAPASLIHHDETHHHPPQQQLSPTPLPHNLRNADPECTSTTSQDDWCDALINKQLFPWLWDVDANAIREKQHAGS